MKTKTKVTKSCLATPRERPDANIIIYDGECVFCQKQVARIAAWDRKGILSFLSLHDPEVARRWPDLSHEQLMKEMYLIDQNGNRFAGAHVFRWLSGRLPILLPLYPLMHLPGSMPFWSFGYGLVAKARYKWGKTKSCEDGTCKLHI